MAAVVERFPESEARPARSYPWAQWLDGQVWELCQVTDFDDLHTFRGALAHEAKRRGLRYRTQRKGPFLYLQALTQETP